MDRCDISTNVHTKRRGDTEEPSRAGTPGVLFFDSTERSLVVTVFSVTAVFYTTLNNSSNLDK